VIEKAHHFDDVRLVAVLQSFKIVPKNERCTPAGGPCSYTVTQQVTNGQRSLPLCTCITAGLCMPQVRE
jgi:hypothetical protein